MRTSIQQREKSSKRRDPLTTQASSAVARSSRPRGASRAQVRGGKNKITKNGSGASIIVVKLLRTDTTLDLSQKARVVKNQECLLELYILTRALAHGPAIKLVII